MKKIFKFIAVFAFSAFLMCGCKIGFDGNGNGDGGKYYQSPTNGLTQTGFNEEVYVWESFIFSTNRVENAR